MLCYPAVMAATADASLVLGQPFVRATLPFSIAQRFESVAPKGPGYQKAFFLLIGAYHPCACCRNVVSRRFSFRLSLKVESCIKNLGLPSGELASSSKLDALGSLRCLTLPFEVRASLCSNSCTCAYPLECRRQRLDGSKFEANTRQLVFIWCYLLAHNDDLCTLGTPRWHSGPCGGHRCYRANVLALFLKEISKK
jgi:hypothetical protein